MAENRQAFLRAAGAIGAQLCTDAFWHGGRCNWLGRTTEDVAVPDAYTPPTTRALGPDLYSGTSGGGSSSGPQSSSGVKDGDVVDAEYVDA